MVKGKAREKLLWMVAGGLAIGFVGERVIFSGLRTKSRTLRQQIVAEEVQLRTSVSLQKQKATILQDQQKYADYFLPGLPDRELMVTFLKETERLAQESGVAIVDLTPDHQPSKTAGQTTYKAQLKAEAALEPIVNLLYQLQKSRLLLRLDRFSLTPKDEQASAIRLDATISVIVP